MPLPVPYHDSIRYAVDIHLTEADLSPAVIGSDLFMGWALDAVLARDANAASYTDGSDEQRHVKRAWELLTASRIALRWQPRKKSERFDNGRYQYETATWDPSDRSATLRAWAEEEFLAYLDPDDTVSDFPIGFTLAHGYRGR